MTIPTTIYDERPSTLRVTVPTWAKTAAARIGREHAGRKLETILAALVAAARNRRQPLRPENRKPALKNHGPL